MDIAQWHQSARDSYVYRKGDIIRIKDNLIVGEMYGHIPFTEDKEFFAGVACRIDAQGPTGNYYLAIDGGTWSKEMFEPASPLDLKYNRMPIVGDRVKMQSESVLQEIFGREKVMWLYANKKGVIDGYVASSDKYRIFGLGSGNLWPRSAFRVIRNGIHYATLGERVRIKHNLKEYEEYDGGCIVTKKMMKFRGRESIITKIYWRGDRFRLTVDNEQWLWSSDMVEFLDDMRE